MKKRSNVLEVSFYPFDGFPAVGLLPGIRNNGQALLVPKVRLSNPR